MGRRIILTDALFSVYADIESIDSGGTTPTTISAPTISFSGSTCTITHTNTPASEYHVYYNILDQEYNMVVSETLYSSPFTVQDGYTVVAYCTDLTDSVKSNNAISTLGGSGSGGNEGSIVNIQVQLNNIDAGTVTGTGTYQIGQTVTLTATANSGYKFVSWIKSDGTNTRVGGLPTYTFTATESVLLVCVFEESDEIEPDFNANIFEQIDADNYEAGSWYFDSNANTTVWYNADSFTGGNTVIKRGISQHNSDTNYMISFAELGLPSTIDIPKNTSFLYMSGTDYEYTRDVKDENDEPYVRQMNLPELISVAVYNSERNRIGQLSAVGNGNIGITWKNSSVDITNVMYFTLQVNLSNDSHKSDTGAELKDFVLNTLKANVKLNESFVNSIES